MSRQSLLLIRKMHYGVLFLWSSATSSHPHTVSCEIYYVLVTIYYICTQIQIKLPSLFLLWLIDRPVYQGQQNSTSIKIVKLAYRYKQQRIKIIHKQWLRISLSWCLPNQQMSLSHDLPTVPMLMTCVLCRSVSKGFKRFLSFKQRQANGWNHYSE